MKTSERNYSAVMNDAGELRVWLAERYGSSLYFGCHISTARMVYRMAVRLAKMIGETPETVYEQIIADFAVAEGLA